MASAAAVVDRQRLGEGRIGLGRHARLGGVADRDRGAGVDRGQHAVDAAQAVARVDLEVVGVGPLVEHVDAGLGGLLGGRVGDALLLQDDATDLVTRLAGEKLGA